MGGCELTEMGIGDKGATRGGMRGVLEGHAARGVVGEVARTRRVVLGSGLSCTLVAVARFTRDSLGLKILFLWKRKQ